MNPTQTAAPLYRAELTPYRSLGRAGVRRVSVLMAALALVPGTFFYVIGAWPVVGFLGLDVIGLFWALNFSLGDRRIREEIALWRDRLLVSHLPRRGGARRYRFNPFWVRFRVERDNFDRVTALALVGRGGPLEIGRFLGPEAKAEFAREFAAALNRARN
jgi:uncharacterized membrane protein